VGIGDWKLSCRS